MLSLLLFSIYVGRVVYLNINSKGFRVETEVHERNESFISNNFQYNMQDFKILNKQELKEEFNIDTDDSEDTMYLLAKVDVKYLGEETNKISPIYNAKFESGSWKNGIDNKLIGEINTEDMHFNHDEEKTLYIIVAARSVQFSKSEWNNRNTRKFNLVLQTYPKKVEIICY